MLTIEGNKQTQTTSTVFIATVIILYNISWYHKHNNYYTYFTLVNQERSHLVRQRRQENNSTIMIQLITPT